jgi:hypothetical protein
MRSPFSAGACAALALVSLPPVLAGQRAPERPRPYPVFETPGFARAVTAGTRTRTGRPGERYWQQYARYRLAAALDPSAKRITGRGTVVYLNRSPDSLASLTFNFYQDLFAPGSPRNDQVNATRGFELVSLAAQGETLYPPALSEQPRVRRAATLAIVRLPRPLAPGDSAVLEFEWAFDVTEQGPRMGHDGEVYFIAYWYPQLAVYDDVNQWVQYPHMSRSEFYMGYADYDVAITVPEGWLVGATGTLVNAAEVLPRAARDRLAQTRRTAEVVHVVTAADRAAGQATARGAAGRLTWRFQATGVRDFAFATSDRYVWDATRAVAGDWTGDGKPDTAAIHTLYRPERAPWVQGGRYTRFAIEFLSRFLWPYPYAHMTAVDGIRSCGGMEYPMMTCIGAARDTMGLFGVTLHETAHMWFPMMVGSNEQAHAWQDEGLTSYNTAQGSREFFNRTDDASLFGGYLFLARAGGEVELMRHGEQYPANSPAYGVASYSKMASILRMLRGLLGEETFNRAYREYGRRWTNRHPTPYDLWNTFNDVSGRDLWWFWRTWFYETWTLDQAIASVTPAGDALEVVVEDRGLAPMPARVAVTRADGSVERLEVPVEVWLGGAKRHTLRVANGATVTKAEIDPEQLFADVDRTNQIWNRQ